MAEDWFADVRKYVADADEGVVRKIVNYLGIALRNRDSSLVSFSDPTEVARVRERFLQKKLGLTDGDDVLAKGLDAVRDLMAGDRTKNRVTVYYLLADWFGKLDLFGGRASAPGTFSFAALGGAAAAGLGAAAANTPAKPRAAKKAPSRAAKAAPVPAAATTPAAAPVAAAKPVAAAAPVAAASLRPAAPAPRTGLYNDGWRPQYAAAFGADTSPGSERSGALLGWLWVALGLLAMLLLARGCAATPDAPMVRGADTDAAIAAPIDPLGSTAATTAPAAAADAAAIPAGAGVVASEQAGKPMLTVYFDSGQAAVSNQLAAQAATLKAYLDANPGATLAVSGYNDPSGNAALNAELSKNRAQGVAAALAAAGIPEASIDLVKPDETTTATVTPEQARRVEVTVR